ncbi:MAG TPA: FAD:protein FMN transferase [Vicinamibacteria bacterium]|nr:FAD:protein FMN transferase [Vicinamibacteria bacterium]
MTRAALRAPVLRALATAVLAAAPSGVHPQAATPRTAVVFSGPAMGSRYTVRVVMPPGDEAASERVRTAVAGELARVDRLFSGWSPTSELSRLNAHASTEPFPVSAETVAALELARHVSELTGGAFDVTVAPLVEAWGFGPTKGPREVPSGRVLSALRARVGYRQLSLDAARRTVAKARPEVACDVSALAGGWAADRIAAAVVGLGHPDVVVDVGGEVVARGRRPDRGRWRVAIESPDRNRERSLVIELEDAAAATSGDYRQAWTDAQGRRRSHILDPRTGEPIAHGLASATVVDRDGARADALATALLVLGPDEGRSLAARQGLAARLVLRREDGTCVDWLTPSFEALLPPAR